MTVQTPSEFRQPTPDWEPSTGYLIAAVLLWIATVVVGLYGAMTVFGLTIDSGVHFELWWAGVVAVPVGLLLGGATVTTRKIKSRRRGGSLKVFLLSLVVTIVLYGVVWELGHLVSN